MNDDIYFGGVKYISATDAASSSGFTRDYIGKLCRLGKVSGKRVGKNWYVDNTSLEKFRIAQDDLRVKRNESLVKERSLAYQKAIAAIPAPISAPEPKDI